jgi:hypothetical protein
MPTARIDFTHALIDSQELGGDDQHMTSRVYFTMTLNGEAYEGLHVEVKQTVGSNEEDAIEVGPPVGYGGPFNHKPFRTNVQRYYLQLVGSQGRGVRVTAKHVRLRDLLVQQPHSCWINIPESAGSW